MQPPQASAAIAPRRRSRFTVLLSLLEVPLAGALAFSVMVIFTQIACRLLPFQCDDLARLTWLLRGAVVGIVVGLLYWCAAFALGDRRKPRMVIDAIACVIAIAPFVVR